MQNHIFLDKVFFTFFYEITYLFFCGFIEYPFSAPSGDFCLKNLLKTTLDLRIFSGSRISMCLNVFDTIASILKE